MNWDPMSKEVFEWHLQSHVANASRDVAATKALNELLDELLTAGQDWSGQAFVAVLRGDYGSEVRRHGLTVVTEGFKEGGQIVGLARMCVRHGRLPLFEDVVDLGLPKELDTPDNRKHYAAAKTDSGLWLDILSNVDQDPRTSFVFQVRAFSNSQTGRDLADILVRYDPEHGNIALLEAGVGYEVVVEALMRNRISAEAVLAQSSLVSAATQPEPASQARRRRMDV